jgi:hypothetical protein
LTVAALDALAFAHTAPGQGHTYCTPGSAQQPLPPQALHPDEEHDMTIFNKGWLAALAATCALALVGCGGGGGNSGAPGFGGTPGTGGVTTTVRTPEAADLVLVLSASNVANNGTESVVATATAIDGNRSTVAGVPVAISVNSNAIATPKSTKTDAGGKVEASIGIGADRSNRSITVTATSGNITKTALLSVQDTGGGTNGTPSDLLLTLSSATLGSSGTQTVTAIATALDAKRNVLPGVVVAISVDSGATAAPSGSNTDSKGTVTAQIGTGGSSALRTITVTASAPGLAPRTAALQVVTSPPASTPVAADLSIALSAGSLINGGTGTVKATVTAVDTNRNTLAGIPVAISVNSNAVASVSGGATAANGQVTADIGIGSDRSNRSVTVTASSGTVTRSATFSVVGAALTAEFSPRVDARSVNNQVEYRLVDANASPMPGQDISITAQGLPGVSGKTDVNGKFSFAYTAPATAGAFNIVASAAGDTRTQSISVQAAGNTTPIAARPESASLTPTPSVVSVNVAGSTTNQVELRALFLGANNLPVPNVRVRFDVDPANSSDGVATQLGGSVYAYSDATGVARGTFIPGQRSSPTNGVKVRACWGIDDFNTAAVCPAGNLVTSTLTIASEALSVNIRTNNAIKLGAADLTYIKEYVVMVVDAAGQAKADVLITPSVDLTATYKGFYQFNEGITRWEQILTLAETEDYFWNASLVAWEKIPIPNPRPSGFVARPMCPNEDVNRNGVREADAYVAGATPPALANRKEDLNWNGDIDPRKADVAIKMVGSARTDASGLAVVQIEYGKNVATWVDFVITVTASGISGTESRARYVGHLYGLGNLPARAGDFSDKTVPPAFVISPYGRGSIDVVATPTGNVLVPTGVCTDTK